MFNALDTKGRGFDNQLWSLVRDKQFMRLSQASPNFADDFSAFAEPFMREIITRVKNNDPSVPKELQIGLNSDIDNLISTFEENPDFDLAFALFSGLTDVGFQLLQFIREYGKKTTKGSQAGSPRFFTKLQAWIKSPKAKQILTVARGLIMVAYVPLELLSRSDR